MEALRCPIVELRQYTLHPGRRDALIELFDREFVETQEAVGATVLGQFRDAETRAEPLACLQSEHAPNTFPALPVRTGEEVFVWFARFTGEGALDDHLDRLRRSERWRAEVLPALSERLARAPQRLRLSPTGRSLLP